MFAFAFEKLETVAHRDELRLRLAESTARVLQGGAEDAVGIGRAGWRGAFGVELGAKLTVHLEERLGAALGLGEHVAVLVAIALGGVQRGGVLAERGGGGDARGGRLDRTAHVLRERGNGAGGGDGR